MRDAADPGLGQEGSGLGLCLAGTHGSGKFLCTEGREDNVAPTNSTRKVCPPPQLPEGACGDPSLVTSVSEPSMAPTLTFGSKYQSAPCDLQSTA